MWYYIEVCDTKYQCSLPISCLWLLLSRSIMPALYILGLIVPAQAGPIVTTMKKSRWGERANET